MLVNKKAVPYLGIWSNGYNKSKATPQSVKGEFLNVNSSPEGNPHKDT